MILSAHRQDTVRRTSARDITSRKGRVPIVCLTAYTAPMAQMLDQHCDLLLVGDFVGMVLHGLPNTVGVTLEMMILHGQAVMRGARQALVVVDMPFGSYEGSPETAYANAVRLMKETGAGAIKLEGGTTLAGTIAYLVQRGIPVMGHVGLLPRRCWSTAASGPRAAMPASASRSCATPTQPPRPAPSAW